MVDYHLCGRVCSKCGEFKTWLDFGKDSKSFTGFRGTCLSCRKEENIRDREKNRARSKKYYYDHRDDILEKKKEQYPEKRDDKLEYQREYQKERDISPALFCIVAHQLTIEESPREIKDGYLEVKCANSACRKYFTPTNRQIQSRIQSLKGNQAGECRLYCSDGCKQECSLFGQKKYPKGFKKQPKREYSKEFRQMILERDKYICQICNRKFDTKNLQAHHLTPVVCSLMEQLDLDNGICVCKSCHIELHKNEEGITYSELTKIGQQKSI